MAWGLKFVRQWTNRHDEDCKVEFHLKDYSGATQAILGSADSFVLSKELDDFTEPIQAQKADIELLTDNQTKFDIENFYSEDDEAWLCKFFYKGSLYFTGFLLQDESASSFISYEHFIKVSVTDNLGLLNEIDFAEACGDIDPFQSFKISEYFKIILAATGLQLPIQIFANIYETTTDNRTDDAAATFADQTRLYSGTFADDGGKWQSCYDILSAILKAFGCVICQRQGAWCIYRYGELRTLDNTPYPGTQFNYDLTGKTAISLPNAPVIITEKKNTLIGGSENVRYLTRPYKFTKETFNYKQPAKLIFNLGLQDLGDLVSTSTVVRDGETITVKTYSAPYWYLDPVSAGLATNHYYIVVETDSRGVEVTRYLKTTTTLGNSIDYITVSDGAYVNKGDKVSIDVSMRAPNDPGSSAYSYYITIYDGVNRYWLSRGNSGYQDGAWVQNFEVPIRSDFNPSGSDYKDWHSWGVDSLQIPVDGWLNIRLGIMDSDGGETHWKDINLTYQPYINESTQIKGQTHTQTQGGTIKNNNESERFLDDSPRNLIAGTLLTDELTTFSQGNANAWYPNPASDYVTKTQLWQTNPFEEKKLGEITTYDLKIIYDQLRLKLDCSFIFDEVIDNCSTFQLPVLGNLNFRLATINSINFATCICQATLVEVWRSGESIVIPTYAFEYLYERS